MLQNFRYTLEPVLTKSRWDLDSLGAELASARRYLAECDQAVEQTRTELTAVWAEFARLRAEATDLDVAKEASLRQYADRVVAQLQQRLASQREARELRDVVAEQVRRALREVRGMENHRERLQQAHAAELMTEQQKQADDDWLMSHPSQAASE